MIDLNTLKKTVKIETKDEQLEQRKNDYLRSIEHGIKESYRIGMTYYSFNPEDDLYDSYKLKRELKALGYSVEIVREYDSWYGKKVPHKITVRW